MPTFSFGNVSMQKDPRVYAEKVPDIEPSFKRCLGVDLGTTCGVSFCDFIPGKPEQQFTLTMGQWDLSTGAYDTGVLRFVRLRQFLQIVRPDLVIYEDVKHTPPADMMRRGNIGSILARAATSIELLGAFKATLVTWCEERNIPSQGMPISVIKQYATGKGNVGKPAMIAAANERFGTNFSAEEYEKTGVDNIVDSAFCCSMGLDNYSEAFEE